MSSDELWDEVIENLDLSDPDDDDALYPPVDLGKADVQDDETATTPYTNFSVRGMLDELSTTVLAGKTQPHVALSKSKAPAVPETGNAPIDHTTEMRRLDTKIMDKRAFQSYSSMAKWYGFTNANSFKTWMMADPINRRVALKWQQFRAANPQVKGQLQLKNVMETWRDMENETIKRLSRPSEDSMMSWSSKEITAWAMYELVEVHCKLEAGQFYDRMWAQDILEDRMWSLWLCVKKNMVKLSPALQTEEDKLDQQDAMAMVANAGLSNNDNSEETLAEVIKTSLAAQKSKSTAASSSGKRSRVEAQEALDKTSSKPPLPSDLTKNMHTLQQMLQNKSFRLLKKEERMQLVRKSFDGLNRQAIFDKFMKLGTAIAVDYKDRKSAKDCVIEGKRVMKSVYDMYTAYTSATSDAAANLSMDTEEQAKTQASIDALRKIWTEHPDTAKLKSLERMSNTLYGRTYRPDSTSTTWTSPFASEQVDNPLSDIAVTSAAEDSAHRRAIEEDAASDSDSNSTQIAINREATELQKARADGKSLAGLLGNTDWEHSDFKTACVDLSMNPDEHIRFPFMKPSGVSLTWYQLCGIVQSFRILNDPVTKGPIVASAVGLGKTFIAAGIMLRDFENRIVNIVHYAASNKQLDEKKLALAIRELFPNRPYLVIAPKIVLQQWAAALAKTSHYFDFSLYHRETSLKTSMEKAVNAAIAPPDPKKKKVLRLPLEGAEPEKKNPPPGPKLERFNKKIYPAGNSAHIHPRNPFKIRVILTTYQTFSNRHGSAGLFSDRKKDIALHLKKGTMTEDAAKYWTKAYGPQGKKYRILDPNWKHLIKGAVAMTFIDEAHVLRNPEHACNLAVRWNQFKKIVLMTATPIWSGPGDLAGLISLIQTPEAEKKMKNLLRHQRAGDVTTNNPYHSESRKKYLDAARDQADRENREQDLAERALSLDGWQYFVMEQSNNRWKKDNSKKKSKGTNEKQGEEDDHTLPDAESSSSIGKAGHLLYLRQSEAIRVVFDELLIRHTYNSSWPKNKPGNSIGHSLPNCYRYSQSLKPHDLVLNLYNYYSIDYKERLRMPNIQGGLVKGVVINGNAHRALTTSSVFPLALLVGFPKDSPYVKSQAKELEHVRKEMVRRKQEKRRRELSNALRKEAEEDPTKKWDGYPHNPPIDEDDIPTADEILRRFWYKYKTEYTLMETDICVVFEEIRTRAPENIAPAVFLIWTLLSLIRDFTHSDLHGTPRTVHPGNFFVAELPDLKTLASPEHADKCVSKLASIFVESAPKLQLVIGHAWDCVHRDEKFTFWCSFPSTQELVTATLLAHGLKATSLRANMDLKDRTTVIDSFNDPKDSTFQFLVSSYSVGGVGLNLQYDCKGAATVDPPGNRAQLEQMIGRFWRLLQPYNVLIYLLHVQGLYDDEVIGSMYHRSAGEIMASLDGASVMKLTQAKMPDEVKKDPKARTTWFNRLASDFSSGEGFYKGEEEDGVEGIRHVTSFLLDGTPTPARPIVIPDSEEAPPTSDTDMDDIESINQLEIPEGWIESTGPDNIRYIFRRVTGFVVNPAVLGSTTISALSNISPELWEYNPEVELMDNDDDEDVEQGVGHTEPLPPFLIGPGLTEDSGSDNIWDQDIDDLLRICEFFEVEDYKDLPKDRVTLMAAAYDKIAAESITPNGTVEGNPDLPLPPISATRISAHLAPESVPPSSFAQTPKSSKGPPVFNVKIDGKDTDMWEATILVLKSAFTAIHSPLPKGKRTKDNLRRGLWAAIKKTPYPEWYAKSIEEPDTPTKGSKKRKARAGGGRKSKRTLESTGLDIPTSIPTGSEAEDDDDDDA